MTELLNKILLLISTKREGEYWDFKEKYHANKADLLLDIICMANNRADRDGYIIFGVSDDYEIKGIEEDNNRRNQQNIIDFVKAKKFGAGIRPIVEIRTLIIDRKKLDILIVKNSTDTPYFLLEDYFDGKRRVKANYIYTRVGDTNTDIDKCADINHIEYLWKKRFQLNRPPLEQVKQKLKVKNDWKKTDDGYYHIFNPEYKITLEDDDEVGHPEFYSYLMMNDTTYYGILTIKYFETKLYSKQFVILDGGRYITTTPEWGFVGDRFSKNETISYKYYISESMDYVLHKFLLDNNNQEAVWAKDRLYRGVLIYQNEMEKQLFEEYINSNIHLLNDRISEMAQTHEWIEAESEYTKVAIQKRITIGKVLNRVLRNFREQLLLIEKKQENKGELFTVEFLGDENI